MRKVAVVTGIRSEYDILYSIMKAIEEEPGLKLEVVVTGAHLCESFGYTVTDIEKDGFHIAQRITSLLDSDTLAARIKSAGIQLLGLVEALERMKPDILLVLGDREEAVMTALAGCYMNIPVAHISGGDRAWGNVDDTVRHAVTKLAHLHFPTTQENADRIIRMGEENWRVHCVGNAGLDRLVTTRQISRDKLSQRLGFDVNAGPIILLIQHPLSSEFDQAGEQVRITMSAVEEMGIKTLVGYPNSDAGNQQIVKVINEYALRLGFVKPYKSLAREEFVNLLRITDVLVGNSSCGILEAPFLKLPAVNIGNRQKNRQHAENIIFVPHLKEEIVKAVRTALEDGDFRKKVKNCASPYGDGKTGKRIAKVLSQVSLDKRLITKDITY